MPRFSIVVPAYNAEAYIRECLDSLKSQTFGDFEVICVDDASTDDTRSVIGEYLDDSRFQLIVNERNLAQFASRHIGVAATRGDYLMFLDADDALSADALEMLDAHLASSPVDILQFGMSVAIDADSDAEYLEDAWYARKYDAILLEGEGIVRTICLDRPDDMCIHHRIFNGDMARKVLVDLGVFPGLFAAEDIVELMALMLAASSYEVIEDAPYYLYNLGRGVNGNEGSMTAAQFAEHYRSKWSSYRVLQDYIDRNGLRTPMLDYALGSRWAYACEQTLWMWQYSVILEEHVSALVEFAELWPREWVVPAAFLFVSYDAQAVMEADDLASDEMVEIVRRLAVNVEAVTAIQAAGDGSRDASSELLAGITDELLAVCSGESEKRFVDEMMRCLRAACVIQRENCFKTSQLEGEIARLRGEVESLENSRSYKLGTSITAPYRKLRSIGKGRR